MLSAIPSGEVFSKPVPLPQNLIGQLTLGLDAADELISSGGSQREANMCRPKKFLAVLVSSLGLFAISVLSSAAQQPTQNLSEDQVFMLVRRINTAEVEFRIYSHTYAGMHELLHHRLLKNSGINPTDASTGTVGNYSVSVLVSQDGKHYSVALTPTCAISCGFSLFSDESGVIFPAKAFGCSGESSHD